MVIDAILDKMQAQHELSMQDPAYAKEFNQRQELRRIEEAAKKEKIKEQMIEKYGSIEKLYEPQEFEILLFEKLKPFMTFTEDDEEDPLKEERLLWDFPYVDNPYHHFDDYNEFFSEDVIEAARTAYPFPKSPIEAFEEYTYIQNIHIDRSSVFENYDFIESQCIQIRLSLLRNYIQTTDIKSNSDAIAKLALLLWNDENLLYAEKKSKPIQEVIKYLNDGKPITFYAYNYV
jgi:hypothetical protein